MRPGTLAALTAVLVLLMFVGLAFSEGVFDSGQALDRRAEELDGGAFEQWPFVADVGMEDAETMEGAPGGPSLALGGFAGLALDHFSVRDKQNRHVLRVRQLRMSIDMDATKRGVVHISKGHIRGAAITLYRDETGKMSIANAFETGDPKAEPSDSAEEEPQDEGWLIDAGPITLRSVVLTLGFTAKPVKFRIDHAKMHVRKNAESSGPLIYLDHIRGAMLEPSPLPNPVRIAHARGVVRVNGHPMVDMVAQTCLGTSELRLRAVVPSQKKPVELTGDSAGAGGLIGRMGLLITSKAKSEKVHYTHGAVKLEGGPGCEHEPTHDGDAQDARARESTTQDGSVVHD
jgi:hypothetical protein